jgi:RNA-directed DNA polymerase
MGGTQRSQTMSPKLRQIAEQAKSCPDKVFTSLVHLMDVGFLWEAYRRTRKSGAVGVDEVTAEQYAANLEENLQNLHDRMRGGKYKAPPVKRIWIDKEDGSKRPIGIPAFEDKIVQRSVTMLLEAVYEPSFHDFSHGFRKGHSPHQALQQLREQCMKLNIGWIVDADVSGFFDNIAHEILREFIRKRVNDGGLLRFIGKWLNAGVLEGEVLTYSDKGTPQGGVVSPMLANIFLHYVLDEWFVQDVKPRMRGRCFIVRFADDFVIGCELESDALRLMEVLPKRFARFNLTIHPKKTVLVDFRRPGPEQGSGKGNGTFKFLGFTHYWGRSRQGRWVVKKKTAAKRLRRSMTGLWKWCRNNRHEKIGEQKLKLSQKLRGHYQYFGISGNYPSIEKLYKSVTKAWKYWLSRRCSKGNLSWPEFTKMLTDYPLPRPRIVHKAY